MANKAKTSAPLDSVPIKPQGWKLWVGLTLTLYGAFATWRYVDYERHANHIDAIVDSVQNERLSGRRGSVPVYRPVVTFTPPGAQFPITAASTTASTTYHYAKGDKIHIEYETDNPSGTVRVDSGISWLDVCLGLGGVAALGSYISEVVASRKQRRANA